MHSAGTEKVTEPAKHSCWCQFLSSCRIKIWLYSRSVFLFLKVPYFDWVALNTRYQKIRYVPFWTKRPEKWGSDTSGNLIQIIPALQLFSLVFSLYYCYTIRMFTWIPLQLGHSVFVCSPVSPLASLFLLVFYLHRIFLNSRHNRFPACPMAGRSSCYSFVSS